MSLGSCTHAYLNYPAALAIHNEVQDDRENAGSPKVNGPAYRCPLSADISTSGVGKNASPGLLTYQPRLLTLHAWQRFIPYFCCAVTPTSSRKAAPDKLSSVLGTVTGISTRLQSRAV